VVLREELYHPILSHFPIVLLSLFPLLHLSYYFIKKNEILLFKQFFLYVGSLFYFMSMFTGDEAADHIKSTFCYLGEIYQHEQSAEYGLIALIITLLLDISWHLVDKAKKNKIKKLINHLVSISSLLVLYWVVDTAHLGAMLVYERGAGVKTANKCE
jgi:uncharacterized membrane protein